MRPASFFLALIFLSVVRRGATQREDDDGFCALDDSLVGRVRDDYERCQANQGAFGNWKVSQRCVSDYYRNCMALNSTQYCTVVRSTNYAFGVCLNAGCARGECAGVYQCTGAEEEMRKLVGTLDETDLRGCCNENEDDCFRKRNAAHPLGHGVWGLSTTSISVAVAVLLCTYIF